jgi:hypothetical protein
LVAVIIRLDKLSIFTYKNLMLQYMVDQFFNLHHGQQIILFREDFY